MDHPLAGEFVEGGGGDEQTNVTTSSTSAATAAAGGGGGGGRSPTSLSNSTSTSPSSTAAVCARGPVAPLDREAMKTWVLRTFTADAGFPVVSSVVTEVSALSEDERARLRLARLESMSTTSMTTSGGITTAPVQKANQQQQQQQQPQHQFQDPSAAGEKSSMASQNEIVHMVETMDAELKRHWDAGDRVKALRLAIQSTKMLSHSTKVPDCFPSMFVLVATVLDSLGDRVADRLGELAISRDPIIERLLSEGQNIPHVPPEAAELCGNWFHKILSIRELLCRITVELALLKCFKFAGEKAHVPVKQVIVRLGQQIRGVANSQVASQLRWYLFLRARDELSRLKSNNWAHCLAQCAIDNLEMMSRMPLPAPLEFASDANSTKENDAYLATFQPSLRWMFDTIIRYGGNASGPFIEEAMRIIEETDQLNFGSIAIVFLQCAPPEFLFANFDHVWEFIEKMRYSDSKHSSKLRALAELLAALADPASGVGKLSKSKRAQMLNMVYGAISDNQDKGSAEAYFFALTAAIQFTARYLPFNAVVTVLEEVRNLVSRVEASPTTLVPPLAASGSASSNPNLTAASSSGSGSLADLQNQQRSNLISSLGGMQVIEENIMLVIRVVTESLTPDAYLTCTPFVNLLLTTSSLSAENRQKMVQSILEDGARRITVPSVAQSAFELCRVLHDSLPPTATPEEIDSAETMVTKVVAKTYSPNAVPESLLRFYSECRHVLNRFSNLRKMILYEALRLVVAVPQRMIQKRRPQLRPCLAFVHATCPSVTSPLDRARVAADAACVAYERGFIAQGEALMETALMSLGEVPAVESQAQTSIVTGSIRYNDTPAASVATQLLHVGVVMPPPSATSYSSSSSSSSSSSAASSAASAAAGGGGEGGGPEGEESSSAAAASLSSAPKDLYVVDGVLKWASENFAWNTPSQACKLAATAISLLARAASGQLFYGENNNKKKKSSQESVSAAAAAAASSQQEDSTENNNNAENNVYQFSSLKRIALHKIPEYVRICKSLQLCALRLLKTHMPCEEASDAIDVADVLLSAFLAVPSDKSTHVALHWAMSPLLFGHYAQTEQQVVEFRVSKAALISALEEKSPADLLNHVKKGSGSADFSAYESSVEEEQDEDAI